MAQLDRGLLLAQDRALGNYSQAEFDAMLGYRLLAHAEFEGYLESLAEAAAQRVLLVLKSRPLAPRAEAELLGHIAQAAYPPKSLQVSVATPSSLISRAMGDLLGVINGNNGVSEKDVLKMFLPLGIPATWFDASWLASLTAFTQARGDVTHNSWGNATVIQFPPSHERRVVLDLLRGIDLLTRRVGALCRRV